MLREPTNTIWQALAGRPEMKGFILVGGSALALLLDHRLSEDLDFIWPHPHLPRRALQELTQASSYLHFKPRQDPWAEREADNANLDLDDFSQTFFVNDLVMEPSFVQTPQPEKLLNRQVKALFVWRQ